MTGSSAISARPEERLVGRLDAELRPAYEAFTPTDIDDLATTRSMRLAAAQRELGDRDDGLDVDDRTVPAPPGGAPVPVRVYRPARGTGLSPALLWIHGGGFVTGSVDQSDAHCRQLATELDAVVVSVDYRLAPEHRFPAALDDCLAVLRWLDHTAGELSIDPDRIAVCGSSAGACLAAGLSLMARDVGGPAVCLQLLLHPVLDDRPDTSSPETRVWTHERSQRSWLMYLGSAEGASEYAAPARALDLRGLPPTYVLTTEFDIVRNHAIRFASRLLEAGVPTELHVLPGAFHSFEAIAPAAAMSRRARADYVRTAHRALHRQSEERTMADVVENKSAAENTASENTASENTASENTAAEDTAPRYPVVLAAADAPIMPGRRDWVEYRDLGLVAASAGAVSMHTTEVDIPVFRETGWHYHTCDCQIVWINAGWLELQFEDGTQRRAEAGSVVFIPGGYGHNEIGTSQQLSILEIFMPAGPQTVSIDVPAAWRSKENGGHESPSQ